jgi:hypothetical protein
MKKAVVIILFFLLSFAGQSEAVLIDFDNLPELSQGDTLTKIGFANLKDALFVKVDRERIFAFFGDDKDDYATEPFDEGYFITDADRYTSHSTEIGFDVPFHELSFVILDLYVRNLFVESLMVTIYNNNGAEGHRTFLANDINYDFGDGRAEPVSFTDKSIDKLIVYGNEHRGWGIDNLSFKYLIDMSDSFHVPEPVHLLLLGSGLIALATIGRRKLFKRRSVNNKGSENQLPYRKTDHIAERRFRQERGSVMDHRTGGERRSGRDRRIVYDRLRSKAV